MLEVILRLRILLIIHSTTQNSKLLNARSKFHAFNKNLFIFSFTSLEITQLFFVHKRNLNETTKTSLRRTRSSSGASWRASGPSGECGTCAATCAATSTCAATCAVTSSACAAASARADCGSGPCGRRRRRRPLAATFGAAASGVLAAIVRGV